MKKSTFSKHGKSRNPCLSIQFNQNNSSTKTTGASSIRKDIRITPVGQYNA
jgi:hypothetical protein